MNPGKSRLLLILAAILLVVLAACAPAEDPTSTPEPTDVPVETAEAEAVETEEAVATEEPTEEAVATEEPTEEMVETEEAVATEEPTEEMVETEEAMATEEMVATEEPTEEMVETEEAMATEEMAATEEPVEVAMATEEPTEEMVETEEAMATEEMVATEEAMATEEMMMTEEAMATEEMVATEEPTEEAMATEEMVATEEPTEEAMATEEMMATEEAMATEEMMMTEEPMTDGEPQVYEAEYSFVYPAGWEATEGNGLVIIRMDSASVYVYSPTQYATVLGGLESASDAEELALFVDRNGFTAGDAVEADDDMMSPPNDLARIAVELPRRGLSGEAVLVDLENGNVTAVLGLSEDGYTDAVAEAVHTILGGIYYPPNIVQLATENEDLSTLVAALAAAELTDTLSGGEYTVFAPTNDAMAAALEALGITLEDLLADTETLTSILQYHVVSGSVMAEAVMEMDGEEVETLQGATVTIAVSDDGVMVNDANVVETDMVANNGVVHIIDAVLLPPAPEEEPAEEAIPTEEAEPTEEAVATEEAETSEETEEAMATEEAEATEEAD